MSAGTTFAKSRRQRFQIPAMTQNSPTFTGGPRAQRRAGTAPRLSRRLFRLDDGYIVLDEAAAHRGADAFAAIAAEWGDYHVIAIATPPDGATERKLDELARAAQSFDRIVICHSFHTAGSADAAARFAHAVRGAGRTECHVVADAHRALRHCV